MKKLIKTAVIFALTIVLIASILAVIFKTFEIKNITIEGSERYSAEQIKEYLVKDISDKTVFLLYLKNKFLKNKDIPFIESYEISITDKNSINVKLYEKRVIGCAAVMGGYMYFDREGIIVESSKEWDGTVPVVTGLIYDEIVLYKPLNIQKKELFNVILEVSRLISKYALDVSSINFNSAYEITLNIDGNEFLLGRQNVYDVQISNIKGILDGVLETMGDNKLRIDMRNFDEDNKKLTAEPIE